VYCLQEAAVTLYLGSSAASCGPLWTHGRRDLWSGGVYDTLGYRQWHAQRRERMRYTPKKLGHVNIFGRNAARDRTWYEDLLGLHTYGFTPGRAAFMTSDLGNSHEIALIEVGEDAPGPQKGQVGLNHLAWYMDSLDDLKELYFRIKEKHIEIEHV